MGPRNVRPGGPVNFPDEHGVVKTQLLQFPGDPSLITALDGNLYESEVQQLSADAFAAAIREPSSHTRDRLRWPRGVGYSWRHDELHVCHRCKPARRCEHLARSDFAYATRWALRRHRIDATDTEAHRKPGGLFRS